MNLRLIEFVRSMYACVPESLSHSSSIYVMYDVMWVEMFSSSVAIVPIFLLIFISRIAYKTFAFCSIDEFKREKNSTSCIFYARLQAQNIRYMNCPFPLVRCLSSFATHHCRDVHLKLAFY